jgi:hypothetical protein
MPLNKNNLKNEILQIVTDMRERIEVSDNEYATRLSEAIDNYIKQAVIVYTSGLTSPSGPVTGAFNGRLE